MKEKTRFLLKSAALVVFFYFMGGVIFAQCAGADPFPNEAAEETITANGVKITRIIESVDSNGFPVFKNGRVLMQEDSRTFSRGIRNSSNYHPKPTFVGNKKVTYKFDKPIHSIKIRIGELDTWVYESNYLREAAFIKASCPFVSSSVDVGGILSNGDNGEIFVTLDPLRGFGPEDGIVTLKSKNKIGFTFFSIVIKNSSSSSSLYKSYGVEGGFTVAICENSVEATPVTLAPFPHQTKCEGEAVDFIAKADFTATDTTTPFYGGLTYTFQRSKDRGTTWQTIDSKYGISTNATTHTFTLTNISRENDGDWYRIKYHNRDTFFNSCLFELYSDIAVLSVTYADVKQITATPNSLGTGATPVQFKVVGTPNAMVKYTLNDGSTESVTLNAQGIGLVNKTLSATTVFKATEVSLRGCDFAVTDKSCAVSRLVGCSSLPTPAFATQQSASVTTTNGVKITQFVNNVANSFATGSNAPGVNYCDNVSLLPEGYVRLDHNGRYFGNNRCQYHFSEPVKSVQLWFLKLGNKTAPKGVEKVSIEVGCNGYNLESRIDNIYTCGDGIVGTTIDDSPTQTHILTGYNGESTVGILVSANKPFTMLSINHSEVATATDEVLVTLCPSSVVSGAEILVQPEDQALCAGETLSVAAKYNYPPPYTAIKCQLELKTKNSTNFSPVGTEITLARNVTGTLTLSNVSAYQDEAAYRVRYTFRNSCGSGTFYKYSEVATLTIINPTLTVTSTVVTYCQGQTPTVPIGVTVSGTGSSMLSYQWYRNPINSNTGGTLMVGATGATYTPSTATVSTLYYYVVVTSDSCNIQKTSNPIQVKVVGITTPTVTAATPFCPTATDRQVSFATYVTAAVGHRLY